MEDNLNYTLTTDEASFDSRQKRVNFLCSETTRPALKVAKLRIRREHWAIAPGISLPGRECDQTPPSITKVKNEGICISTASYERSRYGEEQL